MNTEDNQVLGDGTQDEDFQKAKDYSASKQDQEDDDKESNQFFRPGSIKAATFTLLSATLGVGMLSVPKAFFNSGLLLSVTLLYLAFWVSYLSLKALIRTSYYTKLTTFSELATWSYGPKFKIFTDIVFFLNNFGTAIAYSITAKETLSSGFGKVKEMWWSETPNLFVQKDSIFWILVTQGVLIPLVIRETLTELRIFSLVSFCIICYIAIIIVGYCFMPHYTENVDTTLDEVKLIKVGGLSKSLSVFIFGFTCQQNLLCCYRELINPTFRRMKKVVSRHLFLASSIYLLVGTFGYLTFGNDFHKKEENILTKYPQAFTVLLVAFELLRAKCY